MSGDGVVGGPAEECAEAWVRGWARCRGVEARARGEGWQVLVHGAAREVELVLAAPSAALAQRELAALPGLPIRTWLTLLDPPPGLRPVSGTVLREDGEVLQHLPTLPATAPDVRVSLHPEGDDVVAA
ncbi:hypothetical protein, partial [Nocardioides sp.]|uniref:hypothetical protein n=1 Tax=Nocardioides sp. TaxID=35761 RepID=UPI003517BCFE